MIASGTVPPFTCLSTPARYDPSIVVAPSHTWPSNHPRCWTAWGGRGGGAVGAFTYRMEAISRVARMLRTALGPAIAAWLEDPGAVEVMLNLDGCLCVDRLTEGLIDTGERLQAADGERIVRLVAHHVRAEVH